MARMSGLPEHGRPRADRRGPPPRRAVRGALPGDRRLLDRDEAAGQARPGARPRPAAAAARRADQRPRPGRPRRDAGARPADRHRVRDRGHRGQPPARRDRAGVRLPRRHRCRPAAARRAARRRSPSGPASSPSRSRRARRRWPRRSSRAGCRPWPTAARSCSRSTEDAPVRPRPRRRRRPRPAAGPPRAAPAEPRGPVPRRRPDRPPRRRRQRPPERRARQHADTTVGERARRQHLRPRLPGVRRAAPRPPERRPSPCSRQTLRACFGIGRGGRAKIAPFTLAALAILPAVAGGRRRGARRPGRRPAARSRTPRRSATRPTTASSAS